jgi:hypothetical protein
VIAPLGLTGPGGAFSCPPGSLMCRFDVSIQVPDTALARLSRAARMVCSSGCW